jgi:uncharacterized protein
MPNKMSNIFYTLITGASEGFGKALATECARRKMNLILVALPGTELHNLAESLKLDFLVDVVSVEMDLCKDESCLDLFNIVSARGLRVNMIFNNAGIGSTGLFEEGSIKLFEKQIKLNVLATTLITRLFLDMLKHNSPSYILNVGSLASFFPLPKKQVYGATKSFIYYFSKSLRKELKKDKVYVSVLCPGGMNTNMAVRQVIKSGNYLSRISCMNPEDVVPATINGLFRRKEVIIPGRLNKFFLFLNTILPEFIKTSFMNNTMKRLSPGPSSLNFSQKGLTIQAFTRA